MFVCGWVGARVCVCASVRSSVRMFVGVQWDYITTGTIKSTRVICKLSGENFAAEALISFLLQLIVPKNTKSESQLLRKTQTWRETITYSVGLRFSSQTGWVFICQSQLMHPVCSIQLVCFTQTQLDACTNVGPSRCKDEKTFNKAAANL